MDNATKSEFIKVWRALRCKASCKSVKPYKVYTALLTQSGTDAPVATVLENTIGGGDAIYSRDTTGEYTVIFGVDIFTSPNAYVFISFPGATDTSIGAAPIYFNAIGISTFSGGVNSDDVLGPFGISPTPTILEIRLYN